MRWTPTSARLATVVAYDLGRLSAMEDAKKRTAAVGKIKIHGDEELKRLLKCATDGVGAPGDILADQEPKVEPKSVEDDLKGLPTFR